ncbi:flavodoxin domain-containing protein [Luteolibacter flavescens]|uniref:Flavodoxin domain-containing protein n=1 Tax=Luteolibacter flavescens TaxID=1859460 RepID=A0ABT3FPR0_9BACT|nr:flavodoxin domain-containing protein [Luteolibacter flavescens]MCW1885568.1 flavodoxin domain-containing protein [Luteolibacter flavescens]
MNKIHIIFGSQTGMAVDAAIEAGKALKAAGHEVESIDLAHHKTADFLRGCTVVLAVVSTWGDGEPPDDALPFYESLRKACPLGYGHMRFSVLALGDSRYDLFCEAGKELERELLRHGAESLSPRVDCDDGYDEGLAGWMAQVLPMLDPVAAVAGGFRD